MLRAMDSKLMGRMGGLKRAKKLTAKRRKEIARAAAFARWHTPKDRRKRSPQV
jgi:hypothetical protein